MSKVFFYLPAREYGWVKKILWIANNNPKTKQLLINGDKNSLMEFINSLFAAEKGYFNRNLSFLNRHLSLTLVYSSRTAGHILRNDLILKKLDKKPIIKRIEGMTIEDYINSILEKTK